MALQIHPINLLNMTMDASGLVLFRQPGIITTIPVLGFLITGGEGPILVDTGARDMEQFTQYGFKGEQTAAMTIEHHLAQHGLRTTDLRYVVHTHAHVDHAGGTHRIPMSVPVAIARRELQEAASGVMGSAMYTAADTKHLIDRLHTKNALRLFDVDGTFEEEVIPGVTVRLTQGHTGGSISVLVETDEGIANICGDIVYDLNDQLIEPYLDRNYMEPTVTANHSTTLLAEKAAIKRALAGSRFLLPSHDKPALVHGGKIVALHEDAISNPKADVTVAANYTPLAVADPVRA